MNDWDHVEKTVAIIGIVLAVLFLAVCLFIKFY